MWVLPVTLHQPNTYNLTVYALPILLLFFDFHPNVSHLLPDAFLSIHLLLSFLAIHLTVCLLFPDCPAVLSTTTPALLRLNIDFLRVSRPFDLASTV